MSVEVRVPTALRNLTGGSATLTSEGHTVGAVLEELASTHAGLKRHLFTEDGKVRNFVSIYLNDEDVRYLQREATPVRAGDVLSIVPSIAGGTPGAVAYPSLSRLRGTSGTGGAPTPPRALTPEQMKRYSRHLILPEVGLSGQRKLLDSKVLIVGAGGLGSPLALYLAAAGVGTLGMVDFDVVDASNLQRQVLYGTKDIGTAKLEAAKRRLQDLNPDVKVAPHEVRLSSENALDLVSRYDVVVDGTDNFPTRYLVNDASVLLKKPNVYGSIYRFEGQVSVFDARKGPCYRCLYQEPPPPGLVPSCAEGGVLGVLPGIVGSLQAVETLKVLLGKGDTLVGRLLLFDAMGLRFRELKVRKNPDCALCGPNATQKGLIDYEQFCGIGKETEEVTGHEIDPEELKTKLDHGEALILVDVREPGEFEIAHLQGAKLIPRASLPERLGELSTADDLVVYCKMGGRSAQATKFLLEMGFQKVRNLKGGIDAWSERIDPSLPRY
ncbi:MAG: molybdopterin-synthase adenylyltransferase MoeB [Euryarchaeota archaeon]|nr:molybdopterin-synthase adenylyltransferase MoeB [Euryarchaeota archaeon]MDE1836176.1 molybdopterin-synthase adenylyltransferase MoeB [Euryarchaeota archaeon]MDE2045461.1 molybdopterin-synthase adenylyltransferase MoeB [Thermoplasmata archaeon]